MPHGILMPILGKPQASCCGNPMLDLILLAVGLGAFAALALYVRACGRV